MVTFTLPYLLKDKYAGLGSRVGFIYGSIAFLGVVWAYFYLPETAGRSLEELEELWRAKVPPRKFRCKSTCPKLALSRNILTYSII